METYLDPKTGEKVFKVSDDGKVDADKKWLDSKKKKEGEKNDDESGTNKEQDK